MNAAEVFLRAIFGAAPPGYFILVWTLPDKRSRFFDGISDDLFNYLDEVKTKDVYVGVGLRKTSGGTYQRGKATDVEVLLGLWADLDYAGEGHKKPGLPGTLEEIQEFAESLPVKPTMLVHTGGGLHLWWLFKEPWELTGSTPRETEKIRKDALDLVWRWQQTIKSRAARRGRELTGVDWAVDSVHDLARVLRIPGFRNTKTKPHKEVTFLREPDDSLRVDPSEFEPFLIDCGDPPPSADPTQHVDADLPTIDEARARMPWGKHHALCLAEPKFERTWKRKRRDLKDQSPSGYDFAIINELVENEWTDQEIIDALIIHRAEHNDQLKRLDYYAHTIMRVRDTRKGKTAVKVLEEDIQTENVGDPLERMSEVLKMKILGVTYLDSTTPTFIIETEHGKMKGLSAKQLQVFATFQAEVAGLLRHMIPPDVKKSWSAIWGLLIVNATKNNDFGDVASGYQQAKDSIEGYLAEHGPTPDVQTAIVQQMPFIKDNTVWIYGSNFRTWLGRKMDEKVNQHDFGEMMTTYGAKSEPQNVLIHGARTTRLYWHLPVNEFVREMVGSILESPTHQVGEAVSSADTYPESPSHGANGTNGHYKPEE